MIFGKLIFGRFDILMSQYCQIQRYRKNDRIIFCKSCFSCKNIHLDSFRAKILVFLLFMIQTCSHQLVRATYIKRHLCAVLQKYSQGMAEKGVLKLSCRNILKKWQENVVLKKSCKNIHVPPLIWAGLP